jgi:hypothetical protein
MAEQTAKCLDISSWLLMPGKLVGASILSRDPALQSIVTVGTRSLPEKVNFSGISLIGTQVGHHSKRLHFLLLNLTNTTSSNPGRKKKLDPQISCGDASTRKELKGNRVFLLLQHSDYILQRQSLL